MGGLSIAMFECRRVKLAEIELIRCLARRPVYMMWADPMFNKK